MAATTIKALGIQDKVIAETNSEPGAVATGCQTRNEEPLQPGL